MTTTEQTQRWLNRLSDLPSLALPTDYPRPTGESFVESQEKRTIDERIATSLVRLALFDEEAEAEEVEDASSDSDLDSEDQSNSDDKDKDNKKSTSARPTAFHLLLASFIILLHRYTGDTDLVIATSSPSSPDPLLLRIKLEPTDSFWSLVKRVQWLEKEAEEDKIPYETLLKALGRGEGVKEGGGPPEAPIFRVRFFDETDETGSNFLQSTSLTSDFTVSVTSSPSSSSSSTHASGFSTPTTSLRTSLLPSISLTLSYNSLLFSRSRITTTLDQLLHLVHHASLHPLDQLGSISLLTAKQKRLLPDPKGDLHWNAYRGAITDIFSGNAKKWPERTCVVESIASEEVGGVDGKRVFTYKQIDEASNVLAHYLVKGGIKREDVVTVYSTRGVDLVVAVMGVLKAGATFSVIDPAYPPARQTIYLQVAQPRALIVLSDAGQLLPPVRTYVSTKLSLLVEVPALKLLSSGILLGSHSSVEASTATLTPDIFNSVQNLKSVPLGIPLGPDSIGTLSFTSGSTGIPKGVRGRHFSLTGFFDWMGETFGLGEESRFTMLSGIAHDPIQRDIFTPLFLGAQLHIPTAEDIGTPGRLAEWMDDSKVTVTHLTPAMGQLLSAQATRPIPSLTNAFFVGDILTKRDCTRLQQLANNVRIINMFGTTETQRAVSYFPIPPLSSDPTFLKTKKDIMPAGKGMNNVQLLVVNRNDKNQLCGVGEVGEIYVRSGGLAEGYLQLPESTAEKFVENWFGKGVERKDEIRGSGVDWEAYWKGVRDRMYRTGDLGRYGPDGQVECTGRADDQIKIRGFRIELGEIDTHLSRHPAVRENVTLVRRDKYEEKVLVAYFVPNVGGKEVEELVSGEETEGEKGDVGKRLKRYRKLIKDIREYLKTKLPAYSIPSVFVPLSRMPLNPNGKVDKPALPFPDTVAAAATQSLADSISGAPSSTPSMTSTEKTIHDIWVKLLPGSPPSLPLDESFFDLGGHSILATRLIFEIRKSLAVGAPLGLVFDYPTIGTLAKQLDKMRAGDLGLADDEKKIGEGDTEYGDDAEELVKGLKKTYEKPSSSSLEKGRVTVFLTGASGFLGAFILRDLLKRENEVAKVVCHVRAKDGETGLKRLKESGEARGAWDEKWVQEGRVEVVVGDLAEEKLGLKKEDWEKVAEEADVIVHNGAMVHWVYPYAKLRSANVLATLAVIDLASTGKPKALTFISSTATIEKGHYVRLADSIIQQGGQGISESDSLDAGKTGLKNGYGQTKWVSERLLLEAGKRGLAGSIIRPAYIVGDSISAVTNTDDFLMRLVKGCVQLGHIPDINNTINMVPVDHVARITSISALQSTTSPSTTPFQVYHITARPAPRFNSFLSALSLYGYKVEKSEYLPWRTLLEQHVLAVADNALFPLLHFVLDDLPTSTKAASLDDSNTVKLLEGKGEKSAVTVDNVLVGKYLAWLVACGFLEEPPKGGEPFPKLDLQNGVAKAIGRSGGH